MQGHVSSIYVVAFEEAFVLSGKEVVLALFLLTQTNHTWTRS